MSHLSGSPINFANPSTLSSTSLMISAVSIVHHNPGVFKLAHFDDYDSYQYSSSSSLPNPSSMPRARLGGEEGRFTG